MAQDLFRTIVNPRAASGARPRPYYALPLSILLHALVVVVLVVIPLIATDVLPVPHMGIGDWIMVPVVAAPDIPTPPSARAPATPRVVPTQGAPVVAPDRIGAENPLMPTAQVSPDLNLSEPGTGPVFGGERSLGLVVPPPPPPVPDKPVRTGGMVQTPQRIRTVPPIYPEAARLARIEGTVVIDAIITRTGTVREAHVLVSVPLLDQAALEAVRQWTFTPSLLNGVPVEVIMKVEVKFRLR